ncbi:adult cuticle protein 1-like [Hermetia illucens]|uniref:adult cuticle protein 1-like n=1 Tax=Hermetia illucens TaxID=343691 RepID=UPI0018CBF320|nr:adult cuticle protein 1-like [Hermetia illucens]
MKFAAAVVILAALVGIECSIIPLAPALSYTAVSGPTLVAAAPTILGPGIATIRGPAISPLAPAAVAIAPAHAVVAPAVVAAQGSYVAQTRGAVHVAPLDGHANSAASINLQPAPGTI